MLSLFQKGARRPIPARWMHGPRKLPIFNEMKVHLILEPRLATKVRQAPTQASKTRVCWFHIKKGKRGNDVSIMRGGRQGGL
jgi:Ni,Fe-hydrogenase I small subunit